MNNITKDKIKEAILALSFVSDMPIPQRLGEIKDAIHNLDEYVDKNYEKICSFYKNVCNDDKIKLRKFSGFKKKNADGQILDRDYWYYESLHEQIASAVFFHSNDRLREVNKFYKDLNIKFRTLNGMTYKTTNYGNISNYREDMPQCKKEDDVLFRPFYKDWQDKWGEFINRIHNFGANEKISDSSKLFVLKLDFVNAYGNLDVKGWRDTELFSNAIQTKVDSLQAIEEVLQKINNYISADEAKDGEIGGVPYGGPAEAHIAANALLLAKIHEFLSCVVSSGKANFKILDVVSYADDTCILFSSGKKTEEVKEYINNIIKTTAKDLDIYTLSDDDESKTFIFEIDNNDFSRVVSSYTSTSTINAIFLASKLSDDSFGLKYNNESYKSKSKERYERKWVNDSMNNLVNIAHFNSLELDNELIKSLLIENSKSKTHQYLIALLRMFKDRDDFDNVINKFVDLNRGREIYASYIYDELYKAYLELYPSPSTWQFHTFSKYISMVIDGTGTLALFEKGISIDKHGLRHPITHKIAENDKVDPNIFAFIEKNKLNVRSSCNDNVCSIRNGIIVDLIKWIANFNVTGCDFDEINFENIMEGAWGTNPLKVSGPSYWNKTKSLIHFVLNNIFAEKETVLFFRFKRALTISKTRIDFIHNCKYLNMDMSKIIDINDQLITSIDKNHFKLISISIERKNHFKNFDRLVLIRQFCKLIWENGSFSTQTYTTHSERHGDALLINYHRIFTNTSISKMIYSSNINPQTLIASFYLHDIGMILNVDKERFFTGKISAIYSEISNLIRDEHGVKSNEVIITRLSAILGINTEWITPIGLASIAHNVGYSDLIWNNIREKNTAIILSMVDLLDITSSRATILERFMSGSISNEESQRHWLKHYFVKCVDYDVYQSNKKEEWNFDICITINKIPDEYKAYKRKFEEFIKSDIVKWMQPSIDMLVHENKIHNKIIVDVHVNEMSNQYPQNHDINYYQEENLGLKLFK